MEKGPPILDKLISSHFSNMNARLYPEAFMSMSGSKSEQSGVYGGHLLWVLIVRQPGLKLWTTVLRFCKRSAWKHATSGIFLLRRLPPQIDYTDLSVNPTGTKRRLHSTRCWVSGRLFANGRLKLASQVESSRFVSCETHVNWLIQSGTDCSLHVEVKPELSFQTRLSTSASFQDSKHWSKSFQSDSIMFHVCTSLQL